MTRIHSAAKNSVRTGENVRTRNGKGYPRNLRPMWMATLLLSLPAVTLAQQIAIAEYRVPAYNGAAFGITAGPDGALWFTEFSDRIGRITTAGVITEYPVPTAGSQTNEITGGPDGALWFTEYTGNKIGRITTAGAVTEYPVPTADGSPGGITAGPDGALWFTESGYNKIGRITTAGVITEYPVPTAGSDPEEITAGPDGALWFTEESGNRIGRITTAGIITEYPVPTAGSDPLGITAGPDGGLWFADLAWNKIGEAVFVTANLSVGPASGIVGTTLTFTGSTYAPNENIQIYLKGIGSGVLATTTADASGSFTITAPAPPSPYGPRIFLGVGQSSGKLGAADFTVTPRLILNPNTGTAGSTATALGFGFGAFEFVTVFWNNLRTRLGTATTNVNGSAAFTFTVPTGAPPGVNGVFEREVSTAATAGAYFTVQ